MWIFEPHVAENVFENFIEENKIAVYRDHWLDRNDGVEVTNGSIKSIKMLNGTLFKAKIYIDATYEGDLLAAAGVSYHVGRESNSEYNETWNGVQVGTFHHGHNFGDMKISPYKIPGDSSSGVLAYISTDLRGKKAKRIIGFRPIVSDCASQSMRRIVFHLKNRLDMIPRNMNCWPGYMRPAGTKPSTNSIPSPTIRPMSITTDHSAPITSG